MEPPQIRTDEPEIPISILVPVYNVEHYLRQCLDSICNQTFHAIQIICLNDGSTDSSPQILAEYAERDSRIEIITKPNSGYGDSMNQGLQAARGKYIGIVESDDWIAPEMFEELYELAELHDVQIVKSDFFHYSTDVKDIERDIKFNLFSPKMCGRVIKPIEEFDIFYRQACIWSALYRRDFLEKNGIRFLPTPGASFQDTAFNFKLWVAAERVYFTDKAYLHYRVDNAGSSVKSRGKAFFVAGELHEIERYVAERGLNSRLDGIIQQRKMDIYFWNLSRLCGDFAREFAALMVEEFTAARDAGLIDYSLLSAEENRKLLHFLDNPAAFIMEESDTSTRENTKNLVRRAMLKMSTSYRQQYHNRDTLALLEDKNKRFLASLELYDRLRRPKLAETIASPDSDTETFISIIVPVFNTSQFLRTCLDSLLGQSMTNIEVVCVNDGSEDSSLEILREYAKRDSRLIVVDQEHSGVSAARNTGLRYAKAPYIMFCDSDDWFEHDMCRTMHETLLAQHVDVVVCGWQVIFSVSEALKQDVEEYLRLKFYGHRNITWQQIVQTDSSLFNKIYRREIIDRYNIKFPDGLLFEDAYFNDAYMTVSDSIFFLHEPLYNYVRHESRIMSTSYKRVGTAADYLQIVFRLYDYLQCNGLYARFRDFFWHRFLQYYTFAKDHLDGKNLKHMQKEALRFVRDRRNELAIVRSDIRYEVLRQSRFGVPVIRSIKGIYRRFSPMYRIRESTELIIASLLEQQEVAREFLSSSFYSD